MVLKENDLAKITDAFSTGFGVSIENAYKAGYQDGYEDGCKAEQIRLNPAVSGGLRAGSPECGKELGSRGKNS